MSYLLFASFAFQIANAETHDFAFAMSSARVAESTTSLESYADDLKNCPHQENLNHFGPRRNQDGVGLCWSFSATALLEEEACRRDSSLCGTSLSPLDASSCTWTLESYRYRGVVKASEGGWPEDALNCGLKQGVCAEKDAPMASAEMESCSWADRLTASEPMNCLLSRLTGVWETLRARGICAGLNVALSRKEIANVTALVRLPGQNTVDLAKLAEESSNSSEFAKKVLITDRCAPNRHLKNSDKELMVAHVGIHDPARKHWDALVSAMKQNRSAVISVCLDKVREDALGLSPSLVRLSAVIGAVAGRLSDDPVGGAFGCAGHAVVVDGMKYDAGKCLIHIRNSAGVDNKAFEGWTPAVPTIAATLGTDSLTEKK